MHGCSAMTAGRGAAAMWPASSAGATAGVEAAQCRIFAWIAASPGAAWTERRGSLLPDELPPGLRLLGSCRTCCGVCASCDDRIFRGDPKAWRRPRWRRGSPRSWILQ